MSDRGGRVPPLPRQPGSSGGSKERGSRRRRAPSAGGFRELCWKQRHRFGSSPGNVMQPLSHFDVISMFFSSVRLWI